MSGSPSSSKNKYKLNVILDIDETLVYYIKRRFFEYSWSTLSKEEKEKYEVISKDHGIFIIRPELNVFLHQLKCLDCNICLWTWSDMEYAEGIAYMLKQRVPGIEFAHIFAEEDAEASSRKWGNSKDLNWLWYDKSEKPPGFHEYNTILIDDLPGNTNNTSNIMNSITVKPFALFGEVKQRTDPYEDVSKDDILLHVISLLKKIISNPPQCKNINIFTPKNINYEKYFNPINSNISQCLLDDKNKVITGIYVGKNNHSGGKRQHKNKYYKINEKLGRNQVYILTQGKYIKQGGKYIPLNLDNKQSKK